MFQELGEGVDLFHGEAREAESLSSCLSQSLSAEPKQLFQRGCLEDSPLLTQADETRGECPALICVKSHVLYPLAPQTPAQRSDFRYLHRINGAGKFGGRRYRRSHALTQGSLKFSHRINPPRTFRMYLCK